MKKFYAFLFAAVALVGFAACNSDNTEEPAPAGVEKVSFTANIEETKTELDGLQTIWCEGDVVMIDNFEFVTVDGVEFTCTQTGCMSLLNKMVTAVYSKNKDGKIDSAAGVHGALLTATSMLSAAGGEFHFAVQNAFLKLTTTGTVTLKADQAIFSTGDELEIQGENAETVYVAINPAENVAFSCESYGATMKEKTITFAKKTIYNLGELTPFNLYIEDNSGYNKMCVYAWDDNENKILGNWPGSEATTLDTPVVKEGKTYTKVVPLSDKVKAGDNFKFILNNSGMGSQYSNFEPGALSGELYYTANPKTLVYIKKNNIVETWSSGDIYCYMWEDANNNNKNADWSGKKIDKTEYNIYNNNERYYCYDAGENNSFDRLIINNGSAQSVDITIDKDKVGKTTHIELSNNKGDDGKYYLSYQW